MKFKSLPDVSALVLRLALGLPILIQFAWTIQNVLSSISSSALLVTVFIVLGLGSLLLCLGLFTRWAAAAITIYYLISGIIYSIQGQSAMAFIINVLPTLAPYVVIFLLGAGKYSLDQKITNRKK